MDNLQVFENTIMSALAANKSSFSIAQVINMIRETKEDILQDELEHGGTLDLEFWEFISDDIVALFSVFENATLSIYVFPESIRNITPHLDNLSLSQIAELKLLLKEKFSISEPSAVISRGLGEAWLAS